MNRTWILLPLAGCLMAVAHADDQHGTEPTSTDDPYLWLEDVDSDRSLEFVRGLNDETARELKKSRLYKSLYEDALSVLDSESRIPQVNYQGSHLYNYWRDESNPRGVYRRTTVDQFSKDDPEWETILDMDAFNEGNDMNWVFKGMSCLSPDYNKCLARLSPGGGDAVEIREFDMSSKTFVDGGFMLPVAKTQASWRDENSLYVGTDFGDGSLTTSGYPRITKLWLRGTDLDEATTLHEGEATSVSVSAFRMRDDAGDIDLIYEGTSFWTSDIYQWLDGRKHKLQLPDTATMSGYFDGRLLISLKQDWSVDGRDYPAGAVLIADPSRLRGESGRIELLVKPDERTVIESVATSKQGILVTLLKDVVGELKRYESDDDGGWIIRDIPFPANGAINVTSIDDETGHFFASYQSFITPPTLYAVSGPDWRPQAVKQQAESFDADHYTVRQYFAISEDGTKVPYFVVMNKDTEFDGSNPTHIFSYGGFRNSLTPSYSGSYENHYGAYGKLWLDRGGVFVSASIRGGGEYGPAWHQAALLKNKHKSYEDFEAVAMDLIERRITSPEHLGIEGRSNGGLLVGATMTRRPDLYGAVICGVPLLDMKRYHTLLAGASWMAEFGDPDDPDMWQYIQTYSPYQNLKPDTDYPATFFYTSTRDDRVHPGHARKMAARMQEYGYPVWYYENLEGGHGGSSTNQQLATRLALSYAHLWKHLK